MSHQQTLDVTIADGGDYIAMAVAFVAFFIFSWLWWGPLFGKRWAGYLGISMDEKPEGMGKAMALQALSTALIAYVLWHVMTAFTVVHLEDGSGLAKGDLSVLDALTGAFFTWLGFFVPVQLGRVAWEKAPWGLFAINAGGYLVGLALMGIVFALI